MSLNLHLSVMADVIIQKTGKIKTIRDNFDLIQTPTEVTNRLLELKYVDKILEGYIEYYLSTCCDCNDSEYTDCHLKSLKKFVYEHVENGYEIIFEGW
jgi:hypothetical protein